VTTIELTAYKMICDYKNCSCATADHDEFAFYADAQLLSENAGYSEWSSEAGRDYCPCHIALRCERCDENRLSVTDRGETDHAFSDACFPKED
jgi:hypothetical protein